MASGRKALSVWEMAGQWLLLGLFYYACARLTLLLTVPPGVLTAFWPTAGLALAATLFFGYRMVPGIILGAWAVNLHILVESNGVAWPAAWLPALALSTGAAAQASLGAWLIRRLASPPWDLVHMRQAVVVVLLGAPVAGLVYPTIGTAMLSSATFPPDIQYRAENWLGWWAADAVGLFTFAPLFLIWLAWWSDRGLFRRNLAVTIPFMVLLATVTIVYTNTRDDTLSAVADSIERRADTVTARFRATLHQELRGIQSLSALIPDVTDESDAGLERRIAAFLTLNPSLDGLAYLHDIHPSRTGGVVYAGIAVFDAVDRARESIEGILAGAEMQSALAAMISAAEPLIAEVRADGDPGLSYWFLVPRRTGERLDALLARLDMASLLRSSNDDSDSAYLQVIDSRRGKPLIVDGGSLLLADSAISLPAVAAAFRPAIRKVSIAGTDWEFRFVQSQAFIAENVTHQLWIRQMRGFLFLGGTVFLVLVSAGYGVSARRQILQTTQELEAERSFLDTLIEKMPLILYVKDARSRAYLRFNRAAQQIFNAPIGRFIGKTRDQLFGDKIKGGEGDPDDAIVRTGEILDETTEFVHEGRSYWFRSRKVPIRGEDGEVHYILGLAEDITREIAGQKRLEESRRYLELILDSVGEGIFGIDREGNCTFVNSAACRMLRYRDSELLGKRVHEAIHSRYRDGSPYPDANCPILAALQDREVHEVGHEVFWKKDGSSVPVEYVCTPIIEDDAVIGAVVVFSDISRRRALEQLQREHTRRLEQINQELEEFSYIASHDLQEPLRTLNCFCEFLLEDAGENLPERAQTDVNYISEASQRMQMLINEMLDYSRAGRDALDVNEVSLNRCVENARKDLTMLIRDTGARINVGRLPLVMGDEFQLTRVFQNLMHNAIKFRSERTPVIDIREEAPVGEEYVTISVRDNGIGIEKRFHEQIFGAFKRLHPSDRYPGSGIGLAMVKRIIDRHGGRVEVESEPGVGTTFYLRLRKAVVNKPI